MSLSLPPASAVEVIESDPSFRLDGAGASQAFFWYANDKDKN